MKNTHVTILIALFLTSSASPLGAATSRISPTPPATNGPAGPEPVHLTSTLFREIKLTEGGAAATFGLAKVFWKADIAAEKPITIVTPDGRRLYGRPAFLVLANRQTGESLMLGAVTNRIGAIIQPDSVIYTNVLDTGPNISLEYRYLPNGSGLEQNVICLESPEIPSGWTSSDVALEFWTEWIDSVPTASETRSISLRAESRSLAEIKADDQQISFGPVSKLVAGGRAFSLGTKSDSLPVAKTWGSVAPTNGVPSRNFLIEVLDWSAASSQLRALPPTSRRASLSRPKSSRSALLQAALGSEPSRFETARFSRSKFLISSASGPAPSASNTSSSNRRAREIPGMRDSTFRSASSTSPTDSLSPSTPSFVIDWTLLNAVPLPADAVGWWPGGGGPNGTDDATSYHNDGTAYNDPSYAPGKVGQAFNVTYGAHVRIPDSPSLHLTNAMTAEAWIYCVNNDASGSIMSKWIAGSGSDQRCWDLAINQDGTIGFLVTSNGLNSGVVGIRSAPIALNTWIHVAATYDGSTLRLYTNGALATNGAYSHGIFPGTNDFSLSGYVGGADPPTDWAPFFGLIDEATLYRRALSSNEIFSIYNAGPAGKYNPNCVAPPTNIVGWWPGDGNGYDIARTNHGTLYNGASYASAEVAQGFNVPGFNDPEGTTHFRIEDSPDLHLSTGITAEAWIYPTDVNISSIMSKWEATVDSDQRCWDLAFSWDGTLRFLVTSNGLDDGAVDIHSESTIPTYEWTHVAATYDGSYLRVYINGVSQGSAPYSNGIFIGTNNLTISGYTGGTPPGTDPFSPFLGMIDEPTLYSRALSDVEIAAIYAAGSAGKCKIDTDSDGLSDLQEAFLHTDPNNPDTDGDGVNDYIEHIQGRNPGVAGFSADTNAVVRLQVYTPLK